MVFVVDWNPQIRQLYKRCLSAEGFRVVAAAPTESLLDVAGAFIRHNTEIICVISAGCLAGGFNGPDVVKAIRALDENVRIVAATSDEYLAESMLAEGADAWLVKPFDVADLVKAVGGT